MTDQQALSRVLRAFARTMADTYDVTEALHGLSESVVEVLDATAAGVALLDDGHLLYVTATSPAAVEAEQVQERLQDGVCMEAIRIDAPVAVEAARVLADVGAAFVLNATKLADHHETEARLRDALSTRFRTEQAKGVLSVRLGITTTEAFERIRQSARRQGLEIADVAERVIEGGDTAD